MLTQLTCARALSRSRIPRLLPVAVEGERLISCVLFVPGAVTIVLLAAFARSALDGAMCMHDVRHCRSANGVPLVPVSLGVPQARIQTRRPVAERRVGFADVMGGKSVYRPGETRPHVDAYLNAWFGVTGREPSGWDTMTHYGGDARPAPLRLPTRAA